MRLLTATFFCLLALNGCKSVDEMAEERPESTPLAFDPTEKYELARWWSNGATLLRLDEVHSYAIYADNNRYHAPIEVGRWHQQSYDVLWLEPYDRLQREPVRVQISKEDGRLVLSVPSSGPRPAAEGLLALAQPPLVTEDRLLGEWNGDGASLLLLPDGRYHYVPSPGTMPKPTVPGGSSVQLAGHDGSWVVDGDWLTLKPNVPVIPDKVLKVKAVEADQVTLTSDSGELRQATAVAGAQAK